MPGAFPFLIRHATVADVPAMSRLLDLLFSIEADFAPDSARQQRGLELLLARGEYALVLVAERDGGVVGMCSAQVLISTAQGGEVALLEDVVVDPAHRGEGIGAALLDRVEQWGRERGISRLQLLADRSNTPALDFYQRRGWQPTQLMAWRRFPSS